MHASRLILLGSAAIAGVAMAEATDSINARMRGDITHVHDPAIIRQGDTYYLFATGHLGSKAGLTPLRTSRDLVDWTYAGASFAALPRWARRDIAGARGLWAPDISYSNGEYRLYYSVSTFGKNRSAIGLATARRLDARAPAAGWTDRGPVIESHADDDFNAIDPAAFTDREGRQWLAFGSFWSGIKLVRLDPATGLRSGKDRTIHALARRPGAGAIEAPFVIEREGYYYLFASFDYCCRGAESSYYTVVGRSRAPTGPYVDREGRAMMEGGGTTVLPAVHDGADQDGPRHFVGPGHVAILRDRAMDYIIYHAYDVSANGVPTLRIQPLGWMGDGWPMAL